MDALYRTAPLSMGDPDALFAAMLQLPVFEGVTGPVQLGDDGDKLARFELVNLQVLTGPDTCEQRRRRLASSISLPESRVAFVRVGKYDSFTRHLEVSSAHVHAYSIPTHPPLPTAQVSKDRIVFSQGTSTVPVTSHCASYDGNVADPEYYTHVQTSGCSGQVGPTLAFEWVKPPPDDSCVLPANVTVGRCPWSYPWSAELVFSLLIVAPLPGLLLFLLGIVAMACIRADKSSTRMVGAELGTSILGTSILTSIVSHVGRLLDGLGKDKDGQPDVRTGNLLAYLVVWLGIAAHTIVLPLVMVDAESGEVSEDACVARWITVVASSALVLVGITLRVGEEMAADQRENDKEKWCGLRRAIAVAAVLSFLAVITSSAAALTTTENDNPVAVNRTKTEVVSVGGRFPKLAVELQVTYCRSTKELTWAQFWAFFVPWGLMHILGLMVHCERIFRRGLHVNRFPSLLTLLLHGVFVMVTARDTEPEAMTFFVRTPIGIALGWTTLMTEVVWPTYQKYVRRLPNADALFVVKSDETAEEKVTDKLSDLLNGSEKAHHLFISYKWKTSYDKVLSLEPHSAIFHVLLLTVRCPSEQLRCKRSVGSSSSLEGRT